MLVEAEGQVALTRAMRGLTIRLARQLNARIGRSGKVFAERYHARALESPLEVRNALIYVLRNNRHHTTGPGQPARLRLSVHGAILRRVHDAPVPAQKRLRPAGRAARRPCRDLAPEHRMEAPRVDRTARETGVTGRGHVTDAARSFYWPLPRPLRRSRRLESAGVAFAAPRGIVRSRGIAAVAAPRWYPRRKKEPESRQMQSR